MLEPGPVLVLVGVGDVVVAVAVDVTADIGTSLGRLDVWLLVLLAISLRASVVLVACSRSRLGI
jgi:ABC-type amino acid transport system permease subunit